MEKQVLYKTRYFTFGQVHEHKIGAQCFDMDTVVLIRAVDPRSKMVELFGKRWAFEYNNLPDMRLYPKGLIDCTYLKKGGEDECLQSTSTEEPC